MTAEALANLLHARRVGRWGRWQAKCPAHPDRNPSLSIAEGRNGHTLVRCWAGCDTSAVLAALGLRWRDLCGSPVPAKEVRKAAQERVAREREERQERQADRAPRDRMRKLGQVCDALAAKLARTPDGSDGDSLARTYHDALARLRGAEGMLKGRR